MVGLLRMRVLSAMPDPVRKRLSYRTRMLMADGDEFEIGAGDSVTLRRARWAADVVPEPAAPERRGRPPRTAAPEPAPEPQPEAPSLEDKTRDELIELAEERGVELPSGYVRKDELVERLQAEDEDDGA